MLEFHHFAKYQWKYTISTFVIRVELTLLYMLARDYSLCDVFYNVHNVSELPLMFSYNGHFLLKDLKGYFEQY